MFNEFSNQKGFTFIELLIVIGLTVILASATIPVYGQLQNSSQFNSAISETAQALRLAREYSLAGRNNSSFGVYFEVNEYGSDKCVLYQGDSYLTRDESYDIELVFEKTVNITTTLIDNEVNFSKGSGRPSNTGGIKFTANNGTERTIQIYDLGAVTQY